MNSRCLFVDHESRNRILKAAIVAALAIAKEMTKEKIIRSASDAAAEASAVNQASAATSSTVMNGYESQSQNRIPKIKVMAFDRHCDRDRETNGESCFRKNSEMLDVLDARCGRQPSVVVLSTISAISAKVRLPFGDAFFTPARRSRNGGKPSKVCL